MRFGTIVALVGLTSAIRIQETCGTTESAADVACRANQLSQACGTTESAADVKCRADAAAAAKWAWLYHVDTDAFYFFYNI